MSIVGCEPKHANSESELDGSNDDDWQPAMGQESNKAVSVSVGNRSLSFLRSVDYLNMRLGNAINRHLDKHVHVNVEALGGSRPAFQLWVCTGFALAIIVTITLSFRLGMSPVIIGVIAVASVLSILTLATTIKIVTGEEQHVFYQYAITIMAVTLSLLWLLGQPVLPYFDLTALGIGVVLAVGRVGCFMVGCCHGRPSRWGVCYRQEHADAGFVPYYVGVRLFPAQLVESLFVLLIIIAGSFFVLSRKTPGSFLAWYVISYGIGRFCVEFFRGDPERPYLLGYSEAQCTSLALMCFVVWAEHSGVLPLHIWHSIVTAGLILGMIVIAYKRSFQGGTTRQLLESRHVRQVAEVLDAITDKSTEMASVPRWSIMAQQCAPQEIRIGCTSLGLQLSGSKAKNATEGIYNYALSHRDGLAEDAARHLAELILNLRYAGAESRFLPGNRGVFHLLIQSLPQKELPRC